MLDLLARYAFDHRLVTEPGFGPKRVRWALTSDSEGRFTELLPLGEGGRGGDRGEEFSRCPDIPPQVIRAGSEYRSHFLVESAQVVALFDPDAPGQSAADARVTGKHAYFVDLLRRAGETVPGLLAFVQMLGNPAQLTRIRAALAAAKAKPGDPVSLYVNGDVIVNSEAWHDWWRLFRGELTKDGQNVQAMRCFATGEMQAPLRTHPKVRGLGGQPSGDALISFDKKAFASYGLQQAENAAVSEDAAVAYRATLNHLLSTKMRPARLAGATVVHWYAASVPSADDPLAWLNAAFADDQRELQARERAAKLLRAIQTGERAELRGNRYYALTLSGAAGRVMVRDWMEGQFEDLVESVSAWFEDLSITVVDGSRRARDPKLEGLITSLLPQRRSDQKYQDWTKPVGTERVHLWHAALRKGARIPYGALAKVVGLNARFIQTGQLESALYDHQMPPRERGSLRSLLYRRMALLRAWHVRAAKGGHIMPYLNERHPHPAYHCGRLMAVYANLQHSALGDVGAGVVQRYYAAASSTPGLILGRLSRLSQAHLGKLEAPGLARWYEQKLADIAACMSGDPPATLDLAEQSLFALGYYQQLAADWPRARGTDVDENDIEEESHDA